MDTEHNSEEGSKKLRKLEVINGKVNFVCLKEECPSSCCGPFGGVQKGIDSVEGREFSEIVLTPDDTRRLLANGHSHLIELTRSGTYRMRLHEDSTCVAFKNGRCSINDVKPTVCRAFPFYVDMFVGLCGVTECPGFGAGWTTIEKLSNEIQASKEMYQYWLDSIIPETEG
jgi:Fe-S-cluster containining protein